jgi:glutathione S-transferase
VRFEICPNDGCLNAVCRESDAIIEYLVEKYDPENKISVSGDDRHKQLQWLFFQASGQGPYFGQAGWFSKYHPEKVPSAVERYRNEIKRVWSVLETVLSKQEWLLGNKTTVADLSFIPCVLPQVVAYVGSLKRSVLDSWNVYGLKVMTEDGLDVAQQYPAAFKSVHV